MPIPLKILISEDQEDDALLIVTFVVRLSERARELPNYIGTEENV